MDKIKINKELTKRVIAGALALTGIATSFAGCGKNNQKEDASTSTQVIETTQENTEKQSITYFDCLKYPEQQEIKKLLDELHMPAECIKSDEIVSELLNVISGNKDYTSTIDFISSSDKREFYFTNDGNISFCKWGNTLYIKSVSDNNLIIKALKIDKNGEANSVVDMTYCNENGSAYPSDTNITDMGIIIPKNASGVLYTMVKRTTDKNDTTSYSFHHGTNQCLYFGDRNNILGISSVDGEYIYEFTIKISDEEKQEILSNFKEHNHSQLVALEKDLYEKYRDNYIEESYSFSVDSQKSNKFVRASISKDEDGNHLVADILQKDFSDEVRCDISDEQYDALKNHMKRKDENIIAYIEQIDSEHKVADAEAKVSQQPVKIYTKK